MSRLLYLSVIYTIKYWNTHTNIYNTGTWGRVGSNFCTALLKYSLKGRLASKMISSVSVLLDKVISPLPFFSRYCHYCANRSVQRVKIGMHAEPCLAACERCPCTRERCCWTPWRSWRAQRPRWPNKLTEPQQCQTSSGKAPVLVPETIHTGYRCQQGCTTVHYKLHS